VLKEENPQCFLHLLNGGFRELWRLKENTVEGLFRNCLPKLQDVPPAVVSWAQHLAGKLVSAENDYIGAMFILKENPGVKLEEAEKAAIGTALDILKRARPYLFASEKTLKQSSEEWAAIADNVKESLRKYPFDIRHAALEMRRDTFFNVQSRSLAWQLYAEHHPATAVMETLVRAVHAGDSDEVRRLLFPKDDGESSEYPELEEIRETLTTLSKKLAPLRRYVGRAPSGAQVAQVLGIHPFQGSRLIQSVRRKLGQPGMAALLERLGSTNVPLAWKLKQADIASPKHTSEEPDGVDYIFEKAARYTSNQDED